MRKLFLTSFTLVAGLAMGYAQTLFTYGPHSVSKEEFLRVYKKNSINKAPDMSDTALRNYLDLYSLFRMKVAEADKEKLDTIQSISAELDNYRKQLAKNYLTDEQVTNRIIHEAYDRMKEDVHIEHILISCPAGSDTVAAYRKIDSIYHLIIDKKADFETLAREFSDDKGSRERGGDIGYFTVFQTIYPIETVAYTTPVGEVSKPFHTQFGYHIMKVVDKRKDAGQVEVAQIMIKVSKSKGERNDEAARLRADSVETMLKNGVSFDDLVVKYSDDKYSVNDKGILKPFGVGKMVPPFESAAFALKHPGDISEPVKTDYGYHIIKLIRKIPLAPFDSLSATIKKKVENDSRSQTARDYFFAKVKEKNGYKEFPENVKEICDKIAEDTAKARSAEHYKNMNKPVFELGGKKYLQSDFAFYFINLTHGRVNGPKNMAMHDAFNLYVTTVVNDFEEHKLVQENPEFKNLMEEYRDGIMLFELMDRNVWSKASRDTVGLTAYYEAHKNKYMWEPGFEGSVYRFKTRPLLDSGVILMRANVMDEDMVKAINTPARPDGVSVQRGSYEFSHFKDATLADLQQNKMKVLAPPSGPYMIVYAREVYDKPRPKSLDDARGYVVAEYQDYLEKKWNEKMRKEYPLKVNEKVFESMVKK